jgi:hypothetical protein
MIEREVAATLSQEILSDALRWHEELAAGGNPSADRRVMAARCVEAIVDVRLGALHILETAIQLHEDGRPDLALMCLQSGAAAYRDKSPERNFQ